MLILPAVIMAIESDEERALMTKIYYDHQALMYKVAWKYFRTAADVEDIVSDSCEEMIKHLATLSKLERNEMRAYIVTIVRNNCLNLRMKRNRERTVSLDDESPIARTIESRDMLPEHWAQLQDTLDHAMAAIEQLSDREQDILFLRIKEDRGYDEIAALYKTTPANIRKIVERARKHLKVTVYGSDGI